MKIRIEIFRSCAAMAVAAIVLTAAGCGTGPEAGSASGPAEKRATVLQDGPLSASQADLLATAFNIATAIPRDPHIKDKAKAQEEVVAACLKLDQHATALGFIEKIEDWRRGAAYADLAFACAQKGDCEVGEYLERAEEEMQKAEDWRRDVIRVKIARAHELLGDTQTADRLSSGVVESETGKIESVTAMAGTASFEEQQAALDALIATDQFDIRRNALAAYVQLFGRFYGQTADRETAEAKIKANWAPMPIIARIELLEEMARYALDRNDASNSRRLAEEAHTLIMTHDWPLENRMQLIGSIAALRHKAGAGDAAKADVDAAMALFEKEKEKIYDLWRAGALRPLAEAYHSMGDTPKALEVYKLALEEGAKNPNARPRALDLSATCCSMALNGVEPNRQLREKIEEIGNGLREPW